MKRTWYRATIFKHRNISRIFGLHIAGLAAALSIVVSPTHAFNYNLTQNEAGEVLTPIVMTTNSEYHFPLAMTLGMSQPFHALHPGVDLRAPKGTQILAMADGTVVEVGEILVGYGHFVRIAHQGTISTLYAHMDQILVKPGQKVTKGEQLGTVGVTGWSTGPHLHFEVHQGDTAVDPMNYIAKFQ